MLRNVAFCLSLLGQPAIPDTHTPDPMISTVVMTPMVVDASVPSPMLEALEQLPVPADAEVPGLVSTVVAALMQHNYVAILTPIMLLGLWGLSCLFRRKPTAAPIPTEPIVPSTEPTPTVAAESLGPNPGITKS